MILDGRKNPSTGAEQTFLGRTADPAAARARMSAWMRSVRRSAGLGGAAAAAFMLSGCSLFVTAPVEPDRPVPQEEPAVVDEVIAALDPLTGEDAPLPTTEELFEVLIEAGYEPEALEATTDASPLGNDVPSKMFGVHVEEGCVIGEIRGGAASAELMPPSESTGSCLLGDVHRPEGVDAPSGEERSGAVEDDGAGHIPGEDEINRSRDDAEESTEDPGSGSLGEESESSEPEQESGAPEEAPGLGAN